MTVSAPANLISAVGAADPSDPGGRIAQRHTRLWRSRLGCRAVPEEQGGWTTYGERSAYDNPWVAVRLVDVESPAGDRFEYHVVELAPIAIAVIVDDEDRVLLLWKYRFPVDLWGYEVPGGMVDEGELSVTSAARETTEETGWLLNGEPEHLLSIEPLPGQVRSRADVYLWQGATHVGEATDPEEVQTVVEWVPVERIPELVRDEKILGSSTATALLYYYATRRSGGKP